MVNEIDCRDRPPRRFVPRNATEGVDVWPYLTDVLRRIAAIAPSDTAALEALLPDRWVAAHPEHRLEQREEESREAQARRRRKRAVRRAAIT
jgi:transposase